MNTCIPLGWGFGREPVRQDGGPEPPLQQVRSRRNGGNGAEALSHPRVTLQLGGQFLELGGALTGQAGPGSPDRESGAENCAKNSMGKTRRGPVLAQFGNGCLRQFRRERWRRLAAAGEGKAFMSRVL